MSFLKKRGFTRLTTFAYLVFVFSASWLHANPQRCNHSREAAEKTVVHLEPVSKRDCSQVGQVLRDLTAWLRQELPLTEAQRNERLALFQASWDGCYDSIAADADTFMQTYEALRPPLFEGRAFVDPKTLPAESQVLFIMQQWLFEHAFVPGQVHRVAGLTFESADVFPGKVAPTAPRIDFSVTVSATYHTDPATYLSRQENVIRMTGTYAAPGEVVTVEVDPRFAGKGLRVLVGIHQEDLDIVWDSFTRFPRVGNSFPIDAAVTHVANPFGGGIYLTVPDGADLGDMDVTLRGVVKTPYFSIRTGASTTPESWQQELAASGVAWFDWESDYFMMTLPTAMVADIKDPTDIMDKWSRSMVLYARLLGRPTERIRAEYFSIDRQIAFPGTSMPAQYPIMTADTGMPLAPDNDWWSPLKVRNGDLPDDVIFHELGHLHHMPTMFQEIESNVNLPAVYIYNEIYGLDIDQALVHSRHQDFTREEAAVDWMLSSNFRAGRRMGWNDEEYPTRWSELGYQQRGHAKWVDLAALFDWEALGAVNRVFYEENAIKQQRFPKLEDDQVIRAASQVLNANIAPLFEFWGIAPSDALFAELADLPRPRKILDRLLRYRAVAPASAAQFRVYHARLKDHYKHPDSRARFDKYLETLTDAEGQIVVNRIDDIIRKYYGDAALRDVPGPVDRDGLLLHLSTDNIVAPDGDALLTWRDASGNGNHAVATSVNHSPRFVLHGTGDKRVVRFSGDTQSGMRIGDGVNLGRAYTVFLVDAYILDGGHRGRSLHSRTSNWLLGRWEGRATHYAAGFVAPHDRVVPQDTFAIHTAVGAAGFSRYYHNGMDVTSNQNAVGIPGMLGIAAHGAGFGEEVSDLDVAEIIVYNRVLDADEIRAVNDYLARKYARPHVLPDEGLQVMLRAEMVSEGDGDDIFSWVDLSGQNNHGQPVNRLGDHLPNFVVGDGTYPTVVRFSGDKRDGMDIAQDFILLRPYTIFLVDAYSSTGPDRGRSLHAHSTNWLLGRWSGRSGHFAEGWVSGHQVLARDDEFDVHVAVGSADGSRYYRNGVDETVSTQPNASPGRLGLAANSGFFSDEVSDLDVAELFIFDRVLTETEIQMISRYLKAKYRKP